MKRTFLFSKIHGACVTHANFNYEGSFSIDEEILEAANILENEQVNVYNLNSGARFTTYAISATRGSRMMCANGACAHLAIPGDRVIICVYAELEPREWQSFTPQILLLDEFNNYKIKPVVISDY